VQLNKGGKPQGFFSSADPLSIKNTSILKWFKDFQREVLTHQMSQQNLLAVKDFNGDGLDDFYVVRKKSNQYNSIYKIWK